MKKGILVSLTISLVLISCVQKKTVQQEIKTSSNQRIEQGKLLFNNSCGTCHELPSPKAHKNDEWVGIVNVMAKMSKLSEQEGALVYDYIVSENKN